VLQHINMPFSSVIVETLIALRQHSNKAAQE
jgi:hypothetical protein